MSYEDAPIHVTRTNLPGPVVNVPVPLKRDIPGAAHLPHRYYTDPVLPLLSPLGHAINKIAGEYEDKFKDFNIDDINSVERFFAETEKIGKKLKRITNRRYQISPIYDADKAILDRIYSRGTKIENQLVARYPDRFFIRGKKIYIRPRVDG